MQECSRLVHRVIDADGERGVQIDREHDVVRDHFKAIRGHTDLPVKRLHEWLYTVMRPSGCCYLSKL